MKKLVPILALSLLVVACESRADKIKRVCSAYLAHTEDSDFKKMLKVEIYSSSGGLIADHNVVNFCNRYLGS